MMETILGGAAGGLIAVVVWMLFVVPLARRLAVRDFVRKFREAAEEQARVERSWAMPRTFDGWAPEPLSDGTPVAIYDNDTVRMRRTYDARGRRLDD